MTEDQKYQGALYKDKSKKNANSNQTHQTNHQTKGDNNPQPTKKTKMMAHQSYVEDVPEDAHYVPWGNYEGQTEDEKSPVEPLPEAPTPPPAVEEKHVNVFDFLVATGQTPNSSSMNLAKDVQADGESTSLVRYEYDEKYMDGEPLVEYGAGPIPGKMYVTPASKTERRRSRDGDKKDKKRKRLHVDVAGDEEMTDAPPVLHSGLTGGLKSMMRPVFPPSPDYSGDAAENPPASPLKKSKHSKHGKSGHVGNSILDMIKGGSKKSKKSKDKKRHRHREDRERSPKMLEYSKEDKVDGDGQMILFKPRADVFLGFVNKGPESDRGCSMNKALKRFHRERKESGANVSKNKDEKELWRSLRLRRNDRGEIVVFAL